MSAKEQAQGLIDTIKKEQAKLDRFSEDNIQKQRDRIQNKITAYKVQLADLAVASLGA